MAKRGNRADPQAAFCILVVTMVFISITVIGLSAALISKDHHDGVAIAHLVIACILLPLGFVFPLSAIMWFAALMTLVGVSSSRHILAAQWKSQIEQEANGTSVGSAIVGELPIGDLVQKEQQWAHGPYVGLCVCDISGILIGIAGTPLMGSM